MTGSLRWVGLKCLDCGHEAQVARGTIEQAIAGEALMRRLARSWWRFQCGSCSSRRAIVTAHDGRTLFNADETRLCTRCEFPIDLPGLGVVPGTTLCVACAADRARDLERSRQRRQAVWPAPPHDLARCPECLSATVVRENSKSGHRFVGCTSYPRCNWTANLRRHQDVVRVAERTRRA